MSPAAMACASQPSLASKQCRTVSHGHTWCSAGVVATCPCLRLVCAEPCCWLRQWLRKKCMQVGWVAVPYAAHGWLHPMQHMLGSRCSRVWIIGLDYVVMLLVPGYWGSIMLLLHQ